MEIFYVLTKYVQNRLLQNCCMRDWVNIMVFLLIGYTMIASKCSPIEIFEKEKNAKINFVTEDLALVGKDKSKIRIYPFPQTDASAAEKIEPSTQRIKEADNCTLSHIQQI